MQHATADKEEKIVSMFRRGDALAMDRLYADFAPYLTGVCARYISDDDTLKDVLQESFIKIFTQMDSFDYRGRGSLRAWMSRIVVNESLQTLRQQKRTLTLLLDNDPPDLPDEDPDTDSMGREEMAELLRQLPDGYRTVLNLYVIEGRSHKEIAQLLDIKPDSSASQLHRAKNMMARLIKNHKRNKL
ncbi:MAG: RNA polymerase sigma factor [Prevotella sp.]|jgi:RNA polymerase sigma factor (sigma-70 family)